MARTTLERNIDRRLLLAAGLVSSLLLALVGLGPEEASAGPGVIACGATITGDVTLTADLVDCPDNGLIVGADDVTIDLNGHTVDGDNALVKSCGKSEICDTGVVNDGFDDMVVKDGTLRQFGIGTFVLDGEGDRLMNLAVRRNIFSGVIIVGTRGATLRNSNVRADGLTTDQSGIAFFEANRTLIARNKISANGDIGIFTEGTVRSHIVHNKLAGNPEGGIIGDGEKALIARNRFVRNGDGIGWGGNDNVIRANRVRGSSTRGEGGGQGIEFGGGRHNRIVNNTVRDVGKHGVVIEAFGPIRGMVAAGNSIHGAGKDGLVVREVAESASRVRLRANRAFGSKDDGIDVAIRAAGLARNVARNNGDHGIEAHDGVKDGGGNRASGNGNAEQCKNVICT